MAPAGRRAPLLLLSVLAAAVAGDGAAPPLDEGALAAGDECGGSNGGTCALNALQRRGAVQLADARAAAEVEGSEAALAAEGEERSGGNSSWGYGSCSAYGCRGYTAGLMCQCSQDCVGRRNCCWDYGYICAPYYARQQTPKHPPNSNGPATSYNGGVQTLYHQTSPSACHSILKSTFRIGKGGWCGSGIYFAASPQDTRTKAIAASSGSGCMLEVKVNVGKVKKYPCCKHCHGYTDQSLKKEGYDSVQFNPGDGEETIVYNSNRIVSIREIQFQRQWTAHHWHGR